MLEEFADNPALPGVHNWEKSGLGIRVRHCSMLNDDGIPHVWNRHPVRLHHLVLQSADDRSNSKHYSQPMERLTRPMYVMLNMAYGGGTNIKTKRTYTAIPWTCSFNTSAFGKEVAALQRAIRRATPIS